MKVLGITDSVNTCDCCGKKNLARTVAIDIDGEVVYYGTTCATQKHGVKTSIKALNEIGITKARCSNIQEFIKAMKGRGYGNTKVLSPLYDAVSCVVWVWGEVEVAATEFTMAH